MVCFKESEKYKKETFNLLKSEKFLIKFQGKSSLIASCYQEYVEKSNKVKEIESGLAFMGETILKNQEEFKKFHSELLDVVNDLINTIWIDRKSNFNLVLKNINKNLN